VISPPAAEAIVSVNRTDTRSAMERMSRDAFAVFYAQTAPALRAYIRQVSGDPAAADDILQEAYIRLLNAAPAEEMRRKSYLYRTATNLILDHCRAAARERNWLSALRWRQPDVVSPRALATNVARVFALLSVRERSLLWLAYVEGAAHDEIARALDCGEKSVRVLLFRARKRMEGLLQHYNLSPGDLR
jgi:RNA polymerase sigma-70 factor (ECF subfamily)